MIQWVINKYRDQSSYLQVRIWLAISFWLLFMTLISSFIVSALLVYQEWGYALRSMIPFAIIFLVFFWALGNALRVIRITSEEFDRRHKRGDYKTIYLSDDYEFTEENS